jgi:Bacterial lectin
MRKAIFTFLSSFLVLTSFGQEYTVNGNAFRESCRCYTLTPNNITQRGSVWNNNRIDLSQSFDFTFQVFLGCSDNNGADGMAFVLQPISTSVGGTGQGMGFGSINPSVGVTLDTYQNSNPDSDPFYDHIAIQLNGDVSHTSANTITPLTPISATSNNVEDCQNHSLRIVWNAISKTMTTSLGFPRQEIWSIPYSVEIHWCFGVSLPQRERLPIFSVFVLRSLLHSISCQPKKDVSANL